MNVWCKIDDGNEAGLATFDISIANTIAQFGDEFLSPDPFGNRFKPFLAPFVAETIDIKKWQFCTLCVLCCEMSWPLILYNILWCWCWYEQYFSCRCRLAEKKEEKKSIVMKI